MSEVKQKKLQKGIVVSDAMDKTVVVEQVRQIKHPILKKYYKRSVTFKVHDEENVAHIGDTISFYSVRPIAKQKAFMLSKVEEKAVN